MVNNLRKKDNYYKKKSLISPTINSFLKKSKGIVYGSTAVNFYTPPHLDAVPGDYDVYSQSPKKSARKVERKLDKKFKGNYFKVEKAKYMIPNYDGIQDYDKAQYIKNGPSHPQGFKQNTTKYVVTFWNRADG